MRSYGMRLHTTGWRGGGMSLKIAVAGFGRLGRELAARVTEASAAELVAIASERPAASLGLPQQLESTPVVDLEAALGNAEIDLILDAHHGSAEEVAELFASCAEHEKSVVSSTALFDPARELGYPRAQRLDELARSAGVRLLATGFNPGYLLDLLPASWATVCPGWTQVTTRRTGELGSWGRGPREFLGVGRTPEQLEAEIPLPLAVQMNILAAALDARIEALDERRTAIVSPRTHTIGDEVFPPGTAIGFHHQATATTSTGARLEAVWHVMIDLHLVEPEANNGVTLEIDGATPMNLAVTGSFADDPYPATAARMLQSAAAMQRVRTGLLRLEEVPLGWGASWLTEAPVEHEA